MNDIFTGALLCWKPGHSSSHVLKLVTSFEACDHILVLVTSAMALYTVSK